MVAKAFDEMNADGEIRPPYAGLARYLDKHGLAALDGVARPAGEPVVLLVEELLASEEDRAARFGVE